MANLEEYLGSIQICAFDYAMEDYSYCAGQAIAISQNVSLFSLISDIYWPSSSGLFYLPDFSSCAPVGSTELGKVPDLNDPVQIGVRRSLQPYSAIEYVNLPAHNHPVGEAPNTNKPAVAVSISPYFSASQDAGTSDTPTAGGFLAGNTGATIYGGGGFGAQKVDLAGLAIEVDVVPANVAVGETGKGNPDTFEVRNPCLAMNFVICTYGYYPQRP